VLVWNVDQLPQCYVCREVQRAEAWALMFSRIPASPHIQPILDSKLHQSGKPCRRLIPLIARVQSIQLFAEWLLPAFDLKAKASSGSIFVSRLAFCASALRTSCKGAWKRGQAEPLSFISLRGCHGQRPRLLVAVLIHDQRLASPR